MLTLSRRIAAIAVAVGVAVSPAVAAAPAAAGDHHRSDDHHRWARHHWTVRDITDAQFLAEAAQSNRFEIITGQLAQQRATTDAVKELGAMFVQDHTAALAQGAAVAQQLGITVPEGLSPAQQVQVDRLSQLEGPRFDRVWIKIQIRAHSKALKLHLSGALTGDSQAVRDLAISGLPVVTRHLSELLQLAGGASGGHH